MSDGRPLARGLPWSHKRLLTTMTKGLIILSILTLILGGVALALRLTPAPVLSGGHGMAGYGVHEGRQLVVMADGNGNSHFAVCDAAGNHLFNIPLRDCTLDVRFRGGRLRFRENATGREGYIDRLGQVCFEAGGKAEPRPDERGGKAAKPIETAPGQQATTVDGPTNSRQEHGDQAPDLRRMARNNPFYAEAAKVLSGKLTEEDAGRRSMILRYCEHLRTAYTTKDIDFIKQVFSDRALIIVGNVVRTGPDDTKAALPRQRTEYFIRTKKEYISRLKRAFDASRTIDVSFSAFRIMRHPTVDGIYGVSLRQGYRSDRYSDDGYLFLLWDFRNPSMPLIHVRTWQPAASVEAPDDVMDITDFNLN